MKIKITEKFPCGYESIIDVKARRIGGLEDSVRGICPLHGKECVKQNNGVKGE